MCRGCSGVNSTEIRTLILSSRMIPYMCKECVPGIKNAFTLSDRVSALEDALSEIKVNNTQKLEDFEKQVREMSDEVKSMKTSFLVTLEDIKHDLSIIKSASSVSTVASGSVPAAVGGNGTSDVFHEMTERQKRSNNLMVFNLPEINEQDDLERANSLISNLIGAPIVIASASRIGKRNKNGHRSLRLTLQSPYVVHQVLRSKKKLDRSQMIYLEADLTSDQRTELNNLKNELKLRQRNGEKNLFLKYINGIPKLSTKN